MKKLFTLLALTSLLAPNMALLAKDSNSCAQCERIREYNKNHPENNYYWYDDYLKEKDNRDSSQTERQSEKDAEKQ